MKSYTVRIELQNSVLGDYESLHTAMESAGFRKFIISDQGFKYKLPNGEYNISGNFDRATILSLAKNAVATINKTAEILVTESSGRTWANLKVIK